MHIGEVWEARVGRGWEEEEEEEEAILGRRVFLVKSQRWNLARGVKEL